MASGSLFALLDDIVFLTKVAASKTAPVLGDDLAVNAQSLSGDIKPDRELAVVFAVAKGSLLNKAIIVPFALLLSYFLPWLITPLLVCGGAFLCYEGAEKLHLFFKTDKARLKELVSAVSDTDVDLLAFEKTKIRDAIKMDAVLSAEIIVIALGTLLAQPILNQFLVLTLIAVIMTVGVYGIVAILVKLDDIALHLMKQSSENKLDRFRVWFGQALLAFATNLMSFLSFFGMIACLLIGGEIISHLFPFIEELSKSFSFNDVVTLFISAAISLIIGIVVGISIKLLIKVKQRLFQP